MRAAVVVPTNRPDRIRTFADAWASQFHRHDVRLIVCEDAAAKTPGVLPSWAEHYCWADIDEQLGDKAGCIPRRSGGVRSFGFWMAGKDESIDMIVSLDDDVLPLDGADLLWGHWCALEQSHPLRWFNTMGGHTYPRGYPYTQRAGAKPMLNHGLWCGVPDLDAYTQLGNPTMALERCLTLADSALVPPGQYMSLCIMNVAFCREMAPFMFMPPLPEGMKRWDDIWCGIIFKRIADLYGWAVTSGYPCVRHNRASDPLNNLKQEMLGYGINERLWQVVDGVAIGNNPMDTYKRIINAVARDYPELDDTVEAMHAWAQLWENPKETAVAGSCAHPKPGYDSWEHNGYWQCPTCQKWFDYD